MGIIEVQIWVQYLILAAIGRVTFIIIIITSVRRRK
jgi:hypothetical protein